jgi:hypothetical protein
MEFRVPDFEAIGDYINPAIDQDEVRAFKKALLERQYNQ